jgi:hypothetical protein
MTRPLVGHYTALGAGQSALTWATAPAHDMRHGNGRTDGTSPPRDAAASV